MTFKSFIITVLLFCSNLSTVAFAQDEDVIVLTNDPHKELGLYVQTLIDPENNFSPFEIVLPEWSDAWQSNEHGILNLGYIEDAYWLRLNIDSSASIHKQWDLVISTPLLDYIDVYQVFAESGPRLIYRSGMARAFNNRNEDHRYFIVPLEIYNERSNPDSFLIRVETTSTSYLPMQLYPSNEFWAPLQKTDVLNWMFFGIIVAMVLYNLFLFTSVRDVSYLYYVLFISSFAMLHLSLDGYIFQHFWPNDQAYSPLIDTLFSSSSVFFGFLFITYFLNLKTNLPKIHKLVMVIVVVQPPIFVLSIFYPEIPIDIWIVPFVACLLVSAVGIGIFATYRGLVTARYFVIAWVTFALGNVYLISAFMGAQLFSVSPLMVSKIASFTEAMLLSFALAHRIRALREEREKQKIKAEAQSYFLAQISHEIRTPLNGVLGTVDILDRTPMNEEQQSYVDIIKSSGKSLLTLVNDVLDYSKIEAGKMSILNERIAIHDLVTNQVELFRHQANQKNIELKLEIDSAVPHWVQSDSQRIKQIWSNLISNAIKFTDKGSVQISLNVGKVDKVESLVLKIKDTGIGISTSDLKSLFNAYQQVDLGKRKVYGGTGLGLAISKDLAELLGGKISVVSQLNQGSEFTVAIPLHQAQQDNIESKPTRLDEGVKLSILVAEDNHVNQQVVRALLTKMGHEVDIVMQGDYAVAERINPKTSYDLILMDCEMPVMDGYEATRLIRDYEAANSLPMIPIVALTAHALEEVRQRCMQSGMNEFLTKPINSEHLSRTIAKLFQR